MPSRDDRLAFTKEEAAEALRISMDTLERYVMGELRIIRLGRLRLIPRAELERWVERNAARTPGVDR
jgi:excisionase family DNA binding protein